MAGAQKGMKSPTIDEEKKITVPIDTTTEPAKAATDTILRTVADENNCIQLPVRVGQIANDLGLRIRLEDMDWKLEGYLTRDNAGDPIDIVMNRDKPVVRRRFTMAHEIGHYIRKYQDVKDPFNGPHRDKKAAAGFDSDEIWANGFAASLLMPASIVRRYWAEGKSLKEMASIFGVSETAMDIRRANLGLVG